MPWSPTLAQHRTHPQLRTGLLHPPYHSPWFPSIRLYPTLSDSIPASFQLPPGELDGAKRRWAEKKEHQQGQREEEEGLLRELLEKDKKRELERVEREMTGRPGTFYERFSCVSMYVTSCLLGFLLFAWASDVSDRLR